MLPTDILLYDCGIQVANVLSYGGWCSRCMLCAHFSNSTHIQEKARRTIKFLKRCLLDCAFPFSSSTVYIC